MPNNHHLLNRHLFKGYTILHIAAGKGHYNVVKYILGQSNASVNDKENDFDHNPLGFSIKYDGDLRITKLLINKGADPLLISNGKTPLQWAKVKGKKEIENFLKTI